MKQYEVDTGSVVNLSRPVVVRLDGHCFRTYTRGFRRPYDVRIHRAMTGTAADLIERFGAVTAYTESDEISLLFAPHTEEAPSALPFNGRVQKVVSVLAGYASARFNLHMLQQPFSDRQHGADISNGPDSRNCESPLRANAALEEPRQGVSAWDGAHAILEDECHQVAERDQDVEAHLRARVERCEAHFDC